MPHNISDMPHYVMPTKEGSLVTHRNISCNANSMSDFDNDDDENFEDASEFLATDVSSGSLSHHENTNSLRL